MPASNVNIRVLTARIENSERILVGPDLPLAFSVDGDDQTVRQALDVTLGLAFSNQPIQGIPSFSEWDDLSVFQSGSVIQLSDYVSNLNANEPLVCVIGADRAKARLAAPLLASDWKNKQKEAEASEFARRIAPYLKDYIQAGTVVATSQERHWIPASGVVALKRFFHKASSEIAARLHTNPRHPEVGLTGELVFQVFSNPRNQELVKELLEPEGILIRFECEESGGAERLTGHDLGFCVTTRGKDLFSQRAILCQAKRLHPDGDRFGLTSKYGDMVGAGGKSQAQKMLDITPCAFFLLYNPSNIATVLETKGDAIQISSSLDYSENGVTVLPANFVNGIGMMWQNVGSLHPFTSSFVKFMVDDFIQGKVGDSRPEVIRHSLTRGLRQRLGLDDDDDSGGDGPQFSVSFEIDISHSNLDGRN